MNSREISLDSFADHLRMENPFDDNRVTQIDLLVGDIPQINNAAFEQLKLHAQKTSRSEKARGVVVSGSPGIGKSHLLARFGQWARAEKYPFIYLLNLQAGPNDILRTILRATISILTRDFARAPHRSRLYKIVSMAVKSAITQYSPNEIPNLTQCKRLYYRLLKDRNLRGEIYDVLWLLFEDIQSRQFKKPATGLAPLALKWLSGDCLDHDDAVKLGLNLATATDEGSVLSLEEMKDVLRVLCQFTTYRDRSFVLCFDQVDTLSEDQVQTWSATVHALLDLCPGLLIVTSGVDETFLRWTSRDLVSKASWDDRIRQFPVLLSGIDANAAQQLIHSRLENFFKPFSSLPEVAALRVKDGTFPLGHAAVDAMLKESDGTPRTDMRPRDVISRSGAIWDKQVRTILSLGLDQWATTTTPTSSTLVDDSSSDEEVDDSRFLNPEGEHRSTDIVINQKIREHVQARLQRPEELPVDSGNLGGLLTTLLSACENAPFVYRQSLYRQLIGFTPCDQKNGARTAFDFVVEHLDESTGARLRIGVTAASSISGNGATNMLKRIASNLKEADAVDFAILVLDERAPLNLAAAGTERYQELLARNDRFAVETLTFRQYASLDALQSVIGLARAGDLAKVSRDGAEQQIPEDDVYESYHRLERYFASPLLCRLIGRPLESAQAKTLENA